MPPNSSDAGSPQGPKPDLPEAPPPAPLTAQLASKQPIVIEDAGRTVSRLLGWMLAWLGWFGVLVAVIIICVLWAGRSEYYDTSEGISEQFVSGDRYGKDKVAIITVSGVIYGGEGYVKHQIERVRSDKAVKAIVLRIDSPGGTVSGSDYIYHHLLKLREEKAVPLVVSMGGIAASGGYYVAMAVGDQPDSIFAEPTTTTGSIGVIIPHYDISGLLERLDIKDDSIASGPHKQMLSMTRPIPEQERKILQAHVNELFELFKERVRRGRPAFEKDPAALDRLATGEIFTAPKALQLGLVDKIGFQEDAVARAVQLAGLSQQYVRVVRYKRPKSLLDIPLVAQQPAGQQDWRALLEGSAPRAYFLATTLPPLVSSYGWR